MSYRADEIRKRIASRKQRRLNQYRQSNSGFFDYQDEEKFAGQSVITYDGNAGGGSHPLFRKELFLFKMFLSVCLVLVTAILFSYPSEKLEGMRSVVKGLMTKEFQFATVSNWYAEHFGEPLALLPGEQKQTKVDGTQYAVPAFGRVLESFEVNGQGVMVETESKASVEAINEGFVIFAGTKENLGKTVILQHADGSESWYGNLGSISVKLYEFVQMEKEVGKVTDSADNSKGVFYFAIKQGDRFIDPIQVISFE